MRAKSNGRKNSVTANSAGEPSRLAETSFLFGAAALATVIVGSILALVAGNFAQQIFVYAGTFAFCSGLAAAVSGCLTRAKIREFSAALDRLRIRKSPLRVKAERRSLVGILSGCSGIISPLLVLTFASAGVFHADRLFNSNESQVIESLRTINSANTVYYQTCGHSFATKLSDLGLPDSGKAVDCHGVALIDAPLAWGTKLGYRITYIPKHRDDAGRIDAYILRAYPALRSLSGKHSFYTDESRVIRSGSRGIVTPEDPPIE